MKEPEGGGGGREEGHHRQAGEGGGGAPCPIFKDVKNRVANSQSAAQLESPISRRPRQRRRQGSSTGKSLAGNAPAATTTTTTTTTVLSKWAKKRSVRVSLPSGGREGGGGGAVPAKRAYQHPSSAVQQSPQEEGRKGSAVAHANHSTNKAALVQSLTLSRKSVFFHEGLSASGIPTAALAIHRTISQPVAFDDATFMSLQYTVDEEFLGCLTAGPTDVHRHFDFAPLHDSFSPDAWHEGSDLAPPYARGHKSAQPSLSDFQRYLLKTVERPQVSSTAFRSISSEVLKVLLSEMSEEEFKRRFVLVDCRYPYEYDGGHIKHAVNLYEPKRVESLFYPADEVQFAEVRDKIPIFYCEFSQKRGPQMAKQLRKCDRGQSAERWPHVDYKEIYLLDQGYRKFFCDFKRSLQELCEPEHYIPMKHSSYASQLKKYDHHKKRAERNLIKLPIVEPTPLQEPERQLQWGEPPSRPPLSPAVHFLPPLFLNQHHRRHENQLDEEGGGDGRQQGSENREETAGEDRMEEDEL